MTIRTTTRRLTIQRDFCLPGITELQPAGTYTVETDEELIEDVSFASYRRTESRITLAADASRPGVVETITVDPDTLKELAAQS